MNRLDQLREAMLLSVHNGVYRALTDWVAVHHGPPQSLDVAKLQAIVLDFDTFLLQPGLEDSEFTRGVIRMRTLFARHARSATPPTPSAPAALLISPRPSPLPPPLPGPPPPQPLVTDEERLPYDFDANSVLAEALTRVLDAPCWMDQIHLPDWGAALPPMEWQEAR